MSKGYKIQKNLISVFGICASDLGLSQFVSDPSTTLRTGFDIRVSDFASEED
jgi:hypothetical protein